jgi:hypothetical protein
VERVGRLPPIEVRVVLSERALAVHGHLDGLLLVRRREMRRLRHQVRRLLQLRLQLVVPVGGWLLRPVISMSEPAQARSWLEIPIVGAATAEPRLKYDLEASALVIYRGDKAFATFEDEAVRETLLRHADVRPLSDEEGREFEKTLPAALPPPERRTRRMGLGDLVSWLAARVGIQECAGCGKRRRKLNKIPIWGWWARG